MNKHIILFAFLMCSIISIASTLDCQDLNGNSIDWFASINFPGKVQDAESSSTRKFFAYYDINSAAKGQKSFQFGTDYIDNEGSAVFNTLNQLISNNYEVIAWNDGDPSNSTYIYTTGHTKAVLAVDVQTQTGFYLAHSMPNFPQVNGDSLSTEVPNSAKVYGQSFFCMSLDQNTLDQLAGQLISEAPRVYFSSSLSDQTPNIQALGQLNKDSSAAYATRRRFLQKSDLLTQMTVQTRLNSTSIIAFTKSQQAQDQFIFEDLIAPTLQVSLNVESWGRPYESPSCNIQNDIYTTNIQQVQFTSDIYWTAQSDHSKWITSTSASEPYICIGDMNRMTSQGKRGGSFFCQKNKNLWSVFNGIISQVDSSCGGSYYQYV